MAEASVTGGRVYGCLRTNATRAAHQDRPRLKGRSSSASDHSPLAGAPFLATGGSGYWLAYSGFRKK